jgi:hypothetical protein
MTKKKQKFGKAEPMEHVRVQIPNPIRPRAPVDAEPEQPAAQTAGAPAGTRKPRGARAGAQS